MSTFKLEPDLPQPITADDPGPIEPATADPQPDAGEQGQTDAEAAEPDELAELEQFLADIRAAMEPDSQLEDDLEQWKETSDVVHPV